MGRIRIGAAIAVLLLGGTMCSGCDFLLRVLQKEMAQERELFGDVAGYNPKVEELQELLKSAGYNPGTPDGELGFHTRDALREFQEDFGLNVTGYADHKTWDSLVRIYEADFSPSKINMREMQQALVNAGYDPGPIDGKKGPRTRKALVRFQKEKGLTADGKIGENTWRALRKYIRKVQ
ncbi:MAG: hypothetical protein GF333_00965 [Candidatus Omnitrophica bacterium]|nr:hypothetical protein [Candidatus Omnitrophota bacterium]